ncbi:EF-hand domain-containing protein [Aurantiacibacter poecillastricola]|uniref:EF-hand domain-containing protein n=1 Tax=Aurantiacibacter poecillastricola TaxID=3064385 RepID=UPI00273E0D83|nr:EF-hand domain-containing protein [Aurantiacibacter sp. 219JJ12-13]MDP5262071.1 EF-hand domain-containing protein [Aurantiacibacter sp. 219JJ12-13]
MDRMILGAFGALLLVGLGLFWVQGRAQVEQGAPPPDRSPEVSTAADPDALPSADISDLTGPEPPEASELTREQRRFFRYDRNRDLKITRNEMLSSRTDSFRNLDTDGNNLLTFEEWAITTSTRFAEMDANEDQELTQAEFATSAPKPRRTSRPSCNC